MSLDSGSEPDTTHIHPYTTHTKGRNSLLVGTNNRCLLLGTNNRCLRHTVKNRLDVAYYTYVAALHGHLSGPNPRMIRSGG